ncbi:hypothetical protein VTO42DRAFT_6744 [Malbranchea cinnamomea]
MAGHRASSPFPTSHDTLGASSLNTPFFLSSSPPKLGSSYHSSRSKRDIISRPGTTNAVPQRGSLSNRSPSQAPSSDESESEADLSDYTFDLDKLPADVTGTSSVKRGASNTPREVSKKENDGRSSEIGGPRDFTLNLVELVQSGRPAEEVRDEDNKSPFKGEGEEPGHTVMPEDYSEFEPPLDMSTPAHVLSWRKSADNNDTMLKTAEQTQMPCEGRSKTEPVAEEPDLEDKLDLKAEVEKLRSELRRKDESIKANEKRVLDAVSVAQQVRHLQSELQKQSVLLKNQTLLESTVSAQQEQINQLKSELESKNIQLEESRAELERLRCSSQQAEKKSSGPENGERQPEAVEGKSHQSDLSFLRNQLEEKNKALDQTSFKFQETMSAHETRLQEKIAEIDILKAQQDEQCLELNRLDSELESVMRERDFLEKRTADLDKIIHHLETQLESLRSEVLQLKTRADTDLNTLKELARELSIDAHDRSFTDIVGSLREFYESNRKPTPTKAVAFDMNEKSDRGLGELRVQLQEFSSLTRILNLQLESTREELAESKTLRSAMEQENSQLKSQVEDLKATNSTLQESLNRLKEKPGGVTPTAENLRAKPHASDKQNYSSVSQPELAEREDEAATNHPHQVELNSLQSAHVATISALRESYAETTRNLHALLAAAQERETALQAELIALRKRASCQEHELTVLKCEREKLESVIEAKDATAAAMDTKFASVLKKREEVWEARVERLLRDREKMGKILLWTWGEKEIGDTKRDGNGNRSKKGKKPDGPQAYQYKYVQRDEDRE